MRPNLYFAILFLIPTILFSQNSNDKIVYLDSLWKETTKENYKYYRVVKDYYSARDNYKVNDFYKSGTLYMEGNSSMKENLARDGEFIFYYENGNKKLIVNYSNSKLMGKINSWYENGNKKLEGEYIDLDKEIFEELKIFQFWINNKQTVIDGNGHYESEDEFYSEKGEIKNGFRNGIWTGVSHKSNYTYTEEYQNGNMVSGISIDKDGTKHQYQKMQTSPKPKKGIDDFRNFVGKKFRYTAEAIKNKIKGKIIVQFIVNREGEIVSPTILKSLNPDLDNEAIRVVTKYKKWIPGEQRGRKINALYSLPIVLAGSE
ncbi:MAG: TonB family protein [Bacteroidota bacterium]